MEIQPIQIVMIVSGVFGVLLLIASSLLMEAYQKGFENCNEENDIRNKAGHTGPSIWEEYEGCKIALHVLIGTIFGIFAAITQIISAAVCFRSVRSWCGATLAIFIFAVIAFSLPMSTNFKTVFGTSPPGTLSPGIDDAEGKAAQTKGQFFMLMSGLDFCFALVAIAYGCYVISAQANVGIVGTQANVMLVNAHKRMSTMLAKRMSTTSRTH